MSDKDVRPCVPERAQHAASAVTPGAAPSPIRPKLPRLNPITVTVKAFVSKPTLPAFQLAQRTAATYVKFPIEIGAIDRVDDPLAFHLLVHNHLDNVTVTVDYADGEELSVFAQRAKDTFDALLLEEVGIAATILRSDFSGYLTPLFDAFDALKRDLNQDPDKVIHAFGDSVESRTNPWQSFHQQYGEPYWAGLGVLGHLTGGFATLRVDEIFKPLIDASRSHTSLRDSGNSQDPEAPRLLLSIGAPLAKLVAGIQRLPDWAPNPLSESVLSRAADLRILMETLERQVQEEQQTEELFRVRAARLIALTGDEHLKLSLELGFPSRATYFQLLLNTLTARLRAKVIQPLVESGVLPSEEHVRVRFLSCYDAEPLENGGEESRSPSLAALKIYAGVRDFMQSDEIANEFGVNPEPLYKPGICYMVDPNDIWDDPDSIPENNEIVVVRDMFFSPLVPRADYLNIHVGQQPFIENSDNTQGGSR